MVGTGPGDARSRPEHGPLPRPGPEPDAAARPCPQPWSGTAADPDPADHSQQLPSGSQELVRLVRGAQRGDVLAMDELLAVLAPYVGRICGPVALADGQDAAQDALLAVFRGIHGLREPAALFAWARSIAVREAVRTARLARRQREGEAAADPVNLPGTSDVARAADIADVLRRLPPEQRAVLTLRHVEGLDEREAARVLNVPVGTVRSRLFRARAAFRRAWR